VRPSLSPVSICTIVLAKQVDGVVKPAAEERACALEGEEEDEREEEEEQEERDSATRSLRRMRSICERCASSFRSCAWRI